MNSAAIDSREALITAIQQGFMPDYLFFWSHQPAKSEITGKECLSQWYASPFTVEGMPYATAEHFMMAEKARLFGDADTVAKVISAPGPDAAKKLGKLVQGFDEGTWQQHRFEIVVRGNIAKFGQNERLKKFLQATGDKILVEASPYDAIWGIGLAEVDPRASQPEQWRGLNLLGFALMVVRSRL